MATTNDPGYGDPNAPIGSEGWAMRWRIEFQRVVKSLPQAPKVSLRFYQVGQEHRAWTLLKDRNGDHFEDFDAFCREREPWGLGTDPAKFRAYLDAEVGKKAADLITVPPGDGKGGAPEGNRNAAKGGEETTAVAVKAVVSADASKSKQERLRAVLRAPEVIQILYREDLITQEDARKLGPKSPTPDQAAKVAEARQAVEQIPRPREGLPPPEAARAKREFRAKAKQAVARAFGAPAEAVEADSALDVLRRAWSRATPDQRDEFLREARQ